MNQMKEIISEIPKMIINLIQTTNLEMILGRIAEAGIETILEGMINSSIKVIGLRNLVMIK